MVKFFKWLILTIALLAGLVIAVALMIPMFVDVKKYLPDIEPMVTQQTGCSFSMDDDIKLSLFPRAGLHLSNLTLGNPQGFGDQPMVSVKSFEIRVKVMPLFSGQVEVKKIIVDTPRLMLVKNKAGQGNWENIGPTDPGTTDTANKAQPLPPSGDASAQTEPDSTDCPIKSLTIDRFAVINGFLSYADNGTGLSKKVTDLNIDLSGFSLDKALAITIDAQVDGKPVSLSGTAGPLGNNPGTSDINFDLMIKAMDQLAVSLKGQLVKPMADPTVNMTLDLSPFSPRKLFAALDQPFPIETSDSSVMEKLCLKAAVKGSAQAVSLSDGTLVLDDSTMKFSARVRAFEKPDLKLDLSLDKIDIDRYLPGTTEKKSDQTASKGTGSGNTTKAATIDYSPLRRMVLDARATIGSLKVAGLSMSNVTTVLTGKNGIFTLKPFSMNLYQGKAGAQAKVDVRKKRPATNLRLTTSNMHAGPLIRDSSGKDIIEGALNADIALSMTGDTPGLIKKTLAGKGELTFTDGAIVGFDIAGTIRNAKAGIGLGESTTQKPRTDFATLKIPYTANKGLVKISDASLVSPLLRLVAKGQTSLVKQNLDFRIEPKLVATLKGQGDTKERSGLLIPLVISGTWTNPKVRPDLEALLKNKLPDVDDLKQIIKGGGSGSDKKTDLEDTAKGLIKGLFN